MMQTRTSTFSWNSSLDLMHIAGDLGKASLIIGYTWLCKHNPGINWETGKVQITHCPKECNMYLK
jgi:hypothetical protein